MISHLLGMKMEPDQKTLMEFTEEFFRKHWNKEEIGKEPPQWSGKYFLEGSIPNHDKQGCYAFVRGNKITYIGVGTAQGSGRYRGHGIGSRFQSYMKVESEGKYSATDEKLKEADYLITIGFDSEHAYLANALELFLIGRVRPEHNKNKPGN